MRPLPEILKHVGRGARLAKGLDEGEARDAIVRLAADDADPAQIGAFLIAMRMKGETAGELAGLTLGLRTMAQLPLSAESLVDVDLHADGREGRPSLTLASACVAAALGARVLIRGAFGTQFAKNEAGETLTALGINPGAPVAAHERALSAGLAVVDLPVYAPRAARLLAFRARLGVRTCVNSAVKLLDPAGARRQLVGIFHSPYHIPVGGAAARLGAVRAAIVQAPGGVPELAPDKRTRVSLVEDAVFRDAEALPPPAPSDALPTLATAAEHALLTLMVLRDPTRAPAAAVRATLLGAGLIAWAAGLAPELNHGETLVTAEQALCGGRAAAVFDALRACYM